jgi:hypothetical protein
VLEHRAAASGEPGHSAAQGRMRTRDVAGAAVGAGVAGSAALIGTIVLIAEIDHVPIAWLGDDTSAWTPITGVAGLLLGQDAVGAEFDLGPIALGLVALAVYGLALALPALALLVYTQGPRPGAVGAAIHGISYALFAQVLFVNAVVNSLQQVDTVYESAPPWGWWAAHGAYGGTLGIAAAALLGTRPIGR